MEPSGDDNIVGIEKFKTMTVISSDDVKFLVDEDHSYFIKEGNMRIFNIEDKLPLDSNVISCILENIFDDDPLILLNSLNSVLPLSNKSVERAILIKLFKHIKDEDCKKFVEVLDEDKLLDLFEFAEEYSMKSIEETISYYAYNFKLNHLIIIPLIIKEEDKIHRGYNLYFNIPEDDYLFSEKTFDDKNKDEDDYLLSEKTFDGKSYIIKNFSKYIMRFNSFYKNVFYLMNRDDFFDDDLMFHILDNLCVSTHGTRFSKFIILNMMMIIPNVKFVKYLFNKIKSQLFGENYSSIFKVICENWMFEELLELLTSSNNINIRTLNYCIVQICYRKSHIQCRFDQKIEHKLGNMISNFQECSCLIQTFKEREESIRFIMKNKTYKSYLLDRSHLVSLVIPRYIMEDDSFSLDIKKYLIRYNRKYYKSKYLDNLLMNYRDDHKDVELREYHKEIIASEIREKNYKKKKRCHNKKNNSSKN